MMRAREQDQIRLPCWMRRLAGPVCSSPVTRSPHSGIWRPVDAGVETRTCNLRRFAPAFLEAFEFSVGKSAGGGDAAEGEKPNRQAQVARHRADPFPGKHWESLILEEVGVSMRRLSSPHCATGFAREMFGSRASGLSPLRRLPSADEAENVLADSGLETDRPTWLDERRERLHHREMRQKLVGGHLEGVRLEGGRLKIMPYDPITPPAGETLDRAIDGVMHPDYRSAMGCECANRVSGRIHRFAVWTHPLQSCRRARRHSGGGDQPRPRMAQASRDVSHAQLSWADLAPAFRNLCRAWRGSSIPTTHCLSPWGSADLFGWTVLSVRTQLRRDQRQIWV